MPMFACFGKNRQFATTFCKLPQFRELAQGSDMTIGKIWLKHIKSGGKPTGDYTCSICNELFRPMSSDPFALQREFLEHVKQQHPDVAMPAEDVSNSAQRILRKVTEND